jgi:hypothetical protein
MWNTKLGPDWSLVHVASFEPWVNFMTGLAAVHGSWVLVLLTCQMYQVSRQQHNFDSIVNMRFNISRKNS